MSAPRILFVDGGSRFGWCYGPVGSIPISGSDFFANAKGASHQMIYVGAQRWLQKFVTEHEVDVFAVEQPVPDSHLKGQTNAATSHLKHGVIACLFAMAGHHRIYRPVEMPISTIRSKFIGAGNLKGEIAKPRILQKCLALGWIAHDAADLSFDRSDAVAGWYATCLYAAPAIAQPVDDLWVASERRKREAEELSRRYQPATVPERF